MGVLLPTCLLPLSAEILIAKIGVFTMAIRSGAGTGVIVSLVVFVLATVFLLVLSIVFYAGNREQIENIKKAEDSLQVYATTGERANDSVQKIVSLAKSANQSVIGYLNEQLEQRNKMLTGNPSETLEQLNSQFSGIVSTSSPLAMTVTNLQGQLKSRQQELDSRVKELASAHDTIESLNDQINELNQNKEAEVEQVKTEWKDVQDESKELNVKAEDYFTSREDRLNSVREENLERIKDLDKDVEELREEKARLQSTIDDLRGKINSNRMSSVDPSLLVDGTVLEVGSGNDVFLDRGENDHVTLGMKFDIYESSSQLRHDEKGELPRGKATVEVVKVGPTTSTAKITRSTSSQPIVRGNVIVNPIYDPNYKFSFVVHGYFDADGDGDPETDNTFIKDQIIRWGGVLVEDTGVIPGDLDFLVLGISPRKPTHKPSRGASNAMYDAYAKQQRAYEDYESLRQQAKQAQVPILTANRLHVLTGQHRK